VAEQPADAGTGNPEPAQQSTATARSDSRPRQRTSNGQIASLATFEAAISEPHQVAGLYFSSALDCLIESAHDVSHDFFHRPHLYLTLGDETVNRLALLHGQYGYSQLLLAKVQRHQVYCALFGPAAGLGTDDDSDFARLRNGLVNASAAFAERVYDTGVGMLRERVLSAHRPFHEYLTGLLGDSVRWSRDAISGHLAEGVAYPILRSQGVAAVFGVQSPPRPDWPYTEDSNADKLLEEIDRQLRAVGPMTLSNPSTSMLTRERARLTRERVSNLQRVALRGAEAISATIDFDERASSDDELDELITRCYTWGSALTSWTHYPVAVEEPFAVEPGAGAVDGSRPESDALTLGR
jgi:hypothetical protein